MPLQPSRRDTIGPPPRDVSDLAAVVRHQTSYLRSLDPGIQEGRWSTPKPVAKGAPRQLVGGDGAGDDTDYAWEYDDRYTITATGTQSARLSHIPIDESLHVFWHPGGNGGLRLTSEYFTVDDQIVTIPDPGYFSLGDTFSFQYEYEVSDDVLDFEFIGVVGGVLHSTGLYTGNYLTYSPLAEMQAGDFLAVVNRGSVAPGGADVTLGFSSTDPRIARLYASTPPIYEAVYVGFATDSHADVRVDLIGNPGIGVLPGALGVMAIFRGVNNVGPTSAVETGVTTPQVAAIAAIAVTWVGNSSFTTLQAVAPSNYTEAGNTGRDYASTDVSYWYDPSAESSPASTYAGEGCLVIGLT